MKNLFKLFLLTISLVAVPTYAADTKIGFVDVERLLREVPQVEKINAKMLDRFGPKKSELEGLEKEIKNLQEKYKKNELVMTEVQLNQLKENVISKVQAYKQKEAVLQQEVATMRSQEIAVLQKTIRAIIDDIAKSEKYDLIISDGVLHSNATLNITDRILKTMRDKMK